MLMFGVLLTDVDALAWLCRRETGSLLRYFVRRETASKQDSRR